MMLACIASQIAAHVAAAVQEAEAFEARVAAAPEDERAGMRERRAVSLKEQREAAELAARRRHELEVAKASQPRGLLFVLGAIFGIAVS